MQFSKGAIKSYKLQDTDSDNIRDVIIEHVADQTQVLWLKGIGNGVFHEASLISTYNNDEFRQYAMADINNDSYKDLVVATPTGLYLHEQLSDKSFDSKTSLTNDWVIGDYFSFDSTLLPVSSNDVQQDSLTFEDVTGDALPDIIMRASAYNPEYRNLSTMYFSKNLGNTKFSIPTPIVGTYDMSTETLFENVTYTAKDINGDGIKDLITGAQHLYQNSTSDYIASASYYWFDLSKDIIEYSLLLKTTDLDNLPKAFFGDWDQDGVDDFIQPTGSASPLIVSLGKGLGVFENQETISELSLMPLWQRVDLDLDGLDDFLSVDDSQLFWQRKQVNTVGKATKLFDFTGTLLGQYDLDNDTNLDFVSLEGESLTWYRNLGNYVFSVNHITIPQ